MFEKEAEEYKDTYFGFADERISEVQDFEGNYIDISERIMKTFIDGAEFGYNKANEWHYVSKEGHPNKDDIYLTIRKDGLHLGDFCQGGDGDIDCQSWCDYPSEEEIQDDSIIAWKEIVLPELPKESE